jgi:nucleotide-binding universal stress UspA family protein
MALRSILHPTDFSDLSGVAFAHALRIALAARSKLHLLHVLPHETGGALAFPQVRQMLVQWGLSGEDDPPWVIANRLGIEVDTTLLKGQEPTQGILGFLRDSPSDLIVLATHGRDGLEHWLSGSVSEIVARHSAAPTLFVAPGARGFVSQVTGESKLRRALVPIDFHRIRRRPSRRFSSSAGCSRARRSCCTSCISGGPLRRSRQGQQGQVARQR